MEILVKAVLPSDTDVIAILCAMSQDEYEHEFVLGLPRQSSYISSYDKKYAKPRGDTIYSLQQRDPINAIVQYAKEFYNFAVDVKDLSDKFKKLISEKIILSSKKRKYSYDRLRYAFGCLAELTAKDNFTKLRKFFNNIEYGMLRHDMIIESVKVNDLIDAVVVNGALVMNIDGLWSVTYGDKTIDFLDASEMYMHLVKMNDSIIKNISQ